MNQAMLLIDGKNVWSKDGRIYERLDPIRRVPVTKAAAAGQADVNAAVHSAHRAFPAWASTGPGSSD